MVFLSAHGEEEAAANFSSMTWTCFLQWGVHGVHGEAVGCLK